MKITLSVLVLCLTIFPGVQVFGQPIINCPTNGQVIYQGDMLTISWVPRAGSWNNVAISLQDNISGTLNWVAISTTNSGSYTWNVSKWATVHTNFSLGISDGGNATNTSRINIVIPNGPRPPTPVGVHVEIRKVVSIEWTANTNHTYQVQSSEDSSNWVAVVEVRPESTNAVALFYQGSGNQFFRVFDLTP